MNIPTKIDFETKLSGLGENKQSQLKGLQGSAIAFVTRSLFEKVNQPFLLICNNQESAIYLCNDLQNLIGENKVYYFPASFKSPYLEENTTNANIQERAEVLNFINHANNPFIVVTSPEALFEKVVSRQVLTKNTFEIKTKEKLSVEFLSEYLQSVNFIREDFVLEPGHYAMRGGIIDVFSFSNELPYRIEL
ncbi:MAG TPA: hypothetical protein VNX68_09780, partial [Nitrosopumilaceae archaeon]|nr:hypothetical protein [Nitrosopumilaceae archaeon]